MESRVFIVRPELNFCAVGLYTYEYQTLYVFKSFRLPPLLLIPCINKVAMVTATFRKVQRIRNCCKVTVSLRLPFEIPPPWCITSSEKLEIECGPKFGGTGCYVNKYPFVKKWPKFYATHLEIRITLTGHYVTSLKVTV